MAGVVGVMCGEAAVRTRPDSLDLDKECAWRWWESRSGPDRCMRRPRLLI